ncbi:MAG: hypothetical protein CMN76_14415 [Spirochaetaceae bacterium]|nr:hypothetical protein [Spirochaetaceae bacterium]
MALLPGCNIKGFPDDPSIQRLLESTLLSNDPDQIPAGVPGIILTPTGGSVDTSEAGLTDSYTVQLNTEPTAAVNLSFTFDGTQITVNGSSVSPVSIVLDTSCPGATCWSSPQTITVGAVDDANTEANPHSQAISHSATSADTNYSGISISNIVVSITDNDSPGFAIIQSGGSTTATEGATDSYTIALTAAPASPVTVTVNADAQTLVNGGASDALVFDSTCPGPQCWSTPQTVTVDAQDDAIAEGPHSGTLTHSVASADASYSALTIADINVTITDNDTAGISLVESGGSTDTTEAGATDTYTLVLNSEPTANVTITVNGDAQTLINGGSCGVPSASCDFVFSAVTWNVAQTVTISAVDDAVAEGAHNGTVSHGVSSGDANYTTAPGNVTVTISDNDTAGITVTESGGSSQATEGGANDTYTIVLDSEPVSPVTITVNGNGNLQVNGGSCGGASASCDFTFNTGNWNVAQTVTVIAADDATHEGAHSANLTHNIAGADPNYATAPADISVSIVDNDPAPSRFVVVGANGTAMWSPDGQPGNWIDSSPGGLTLNGIAYGNGRFVAIGADSTAWWSYDGTPGSWNNGGPVTGLPLQFLRGIEYGAGRFLVVGNGGRTFVSPDGTTGSWTETTALPTTILNDAAFGNGRFIVVGRTGHARYSDDGGLTWTTSEPEPAGQDINGIAFGNGVFIAVGNSGRIWRSTDDGITWTNVSPTATQLWRVSFLHPGIFIIAGGGGTIWASTDDGLTWNSVGPGGNVLRVLAYTNGNYIAVGFFGQAWWSPNASPGSWLDASPGAPLTDTFIDVATTP